MELDLRCKKLDRKVSVFFIVLFTNLMIIFLLDNKITDANV